MKTFEEAMEAALAIDESQGNSPEGQSLAANVQSIGDMVFNSQAAKDLAVQMIAVFMSERPLDPIRFALSMFGCGVQVGIAMEKREEPLHVTTA